MIKEITELSIDDLEIYKDWLAADWCLIALRGFTKEEISNEIVKIEALIM